MAFFLFFLTAHFTNAALFTCIKYKITHSLLRITLFSSLTWMAKCWWDGWYNTDGAELNKMHNTRHLSQGSLLYPHRIGAGTELFSLYIRLNNRHRCHCCTRGTSETVYTLFAFTLRMCVCSLRNTRTIKKSAGGWICRARILLFSLFFLAKVCIG